MRVLYVLAKPDYFAKGRRGRVAHAIGLAGGLVTVGVNVTVVSGPGAAASLSDVPEINVIEVGETRTDPIAVWRWTGRLLSELRRLLKADPSIDAIIVRYSVSNGFRLRRLFLQNAHVTRCFEVNSLAYHQYSYLPVVLRRIIKRVELAILSAADLLYVVSRPLADDTRRNLSRQRIAVVPNGAHPRPVRHGLDTDEAPDIVRFVYMGVFQKYYELELVVHAFRRLRQQGIEAELHFYGDGDQYSAVEEASEGVPNVTLHGRYDLDELLSSGVLGPSTVLLLPYRSKGMSEIGSPIKLYEYMSFGRAIIASSTPQIREVLEPDVTAVFYEPGTASSLRDAMARLARDGPLRERLGSTSQEEFRSHHTWEARARRLKAELEMAR